MLINARFNGGRFFRWLQGQVRPRLSSQPHVCRISESHAVLCEACHSVVFLRSYTPWNNDQACPWCGNADTARLKFIAAWIRTEAEQTAHWRGQKRKGEEK